MADDNPHQHENEDDALSDNTVLESSTASLTSSITNNREENHRTYHGYKDGKFLFPNDEREHDRHESQHMICNLTFDDRLGLAPPCQYGEKLDRVLDLGTGSGIWAKECGKQHPEAEVLGIDLSIPSNLSAPINVKFQISDMEDEWSYKKPFDYIHARFIQTGVVDWKRLATKAYDALYHGGYFELQEMDMTPRSDDSTLLPEHPLYQFGSLVCEGAAKLGRPFIKVPTLKDILVEVGFIDVTISEFKWPTNTWHWDQDHKDLGERNLENFKFGVEAMAMRPLTRGLDWDRARVELFLVDVRKDLKNEDIHAYFPVYSVIGRKPIQPDEPAADTSVAAWREKLP